MQTFSDILLDFKEIKSNRKLLKSILEKINNKGGALALHTHCEEAMAYNTKNYLPLLWNFYINKRPTLFRLLRILDLHSSTQNDQLIKAMSIILENEHKKSEYLSLDIDLSFTTESWRKLVWVKYKSERWIARRYLEICVFSHLASDLHSGDLFIKGAESYADYRQELIDWQACLPLLTILPAN